MEIKKKKMRAHPNWDKSDDLSEVPVFHIEQFLVSNQAILDDETSLEYLKYSAKMSMFKFKDDAELLSCKNDLTQALTFINKIDEVDVKGVEPLGNVLEIYGGNAQKMRTKQNYIVEDEDGRFSDNTMYEKFDYFKEMKKMNKHMRDNYVVLPRPKNYNPDSE